MPALERHRKRLRVRLGGCIALVGLILVVAGCAKNYGQFSKSAEVGLAFQQGDPLQRAHDVHMGFHVPSIDSLNTWAKKFDAKTTIGAEFTTFKVSDPEGNCIEFYTPNA